MLFIGDICLSVILIDSIYRTGKNYYLSSVFRRRVSEYITDDMDVLFLLHFPLLHHHCVYVCRHGLHKGVKTYIFSIYNLTQQEKKSVKTATEKISGITPSTS